MFPQAVLAYLYKPEKNTCHSFFSYITQASREPVMLYRLQSSQCNIDFGLLPLLQAYAETVLLILTELFVDY